MRHFKLDTLPTVLRPLFGMRGPALAEGEYKAEVLRQATADQGQRQDQGLETGIITLHRSALS